MSDSFTSEDTLAISARNGQTVLTYTADFSFEGLAKIASPVLGMGLQKVGDDAAAQIATCLDRLEG